MRELINKYLKTKILFCAITATSTILLCAAGRLSLIEPHTLYEHGTGR